MYGEVYISTREDHQWQEKLLKFGDEMKVPKGNSNSSYIFWYCFFFLAVRNFLLIFRLLKSEDLVTLMIG